MSQGLYGRDILAEFCLSGQMMLMCSPRRAVIRTSSSSLRIMVVFSAIHASLPSISTARAFPGSCRGDPRSFVLSAFSLRDWDTEVGI